MNLILRPERAGDAPLIEAVTATAFAGAAHATHTEQHIVSALRSAGQRALSLLAQDLDTVIGHVAASPVTVSDGAAGWFGLGPLSVAPHYQRRGVGSRLVPEALRELRAQGARGCVVLGEPDYYSRFGFRADPALVLPGVRAGYFQVLAFATPPPRGSVAYAAAFNA